VQGACTQPSSLSSRQERKLIPAVMQEPKGESLQPHVPAVTGQVAPAPHSLAELQAGSPQMVGLFGHFMMNLAEETCFRSIISASYLSWPG